MKYAYAHTITRQYMMASGAFIIENPDKAADTKAANLSAVESVLKTYQAILKTEAGRESQTSRRSAEEAEPGEAQRCSEAVPLMQE
jgi:hypothetical protein